MSKRRVYKADSDNYKLRVYRDTEWDEYTARVTRLDTKVCVSSYHSDDKEDAIATGHKEMANSELHQVMTKAID
jgi:hypothetical protein